LILHFFHRQIFSSPNGLLIFFWALFSTLIMSKTIARRKCEAKSDDNKNQKHTLNTFKFDRPQATQTIILALPWKKFDFNWANGEYKVNGDPLFIFETDLRSLEEQRDADTGTKVWDAAVILAKYFEKNPKLLEDKSILELGAGTGLLGLATAKLGVSKNVFITDLEFYKETVNRSIAKNEIQKTSAYTLDWNDPSAFTKEVSETIDIIIASDVLWLQPLVEPFMNCLKFFLKINPKLEIFISYQVRSDLVETEFLSRAKEIFSISKIAYAEEKSKWYDEKISVYHLKR